MMKIKCGCLKKDRTQSFRANIVAQHAKPSFNVDFQRVILVNIIFLRGKFFVSSFVARRPPSHSFYLKFLN